MGELKRLPGRTCKHHTTGRCLYEERLNPGYNEKWRCRVLMHWESAFDDFLLRAESFGLSQDAAGNLWNRQFDRLARKAFDCEKYVYCQDADVPSCLHGIDRLCRLALPPCEGRCRHFEADARQSESDNAN